MYLRALLYSSQSIVTTSAIILTLFLIACGAGVTGNNPTAPDWHYVALGDSLADGVLAQEGYVERYAAYVNLDTGANVQTTNLGAPGWHSGDLLKALRKDQAFNDQITGAQVLTWDIGGDDLANAHDNYTKGTCGGPDNQDCLRHAVASFKQNWDAIISTLLRMRSTGNTIIRTMDIYNPYVASDRKAGIFDTLEPYLDEVNNYVHSTAAANGIPVANVHQAFNGADGATDPGTMGLISADGFHHPNDAGHKVIADQLRALQYQPLH